MKSDKDIENLLMSGKKLSLSVTEKDSIKSVLLERASATLKHEKRSTPSPWASWILRGSVSFASLLIVFVGTAYASQDSLPGEPLYVMKVHVVEEMISLTKITPEKRVAYDIQLMENRLAEMKEIVKQDTDIESEDLAVLTGQIDEHVYDVTTKLKEMSSDYLPHKEKIETLSKLSGITKAQAKISIKTLDLTEATNAIKETQKSSSNAIVTTIEEFVAEESVEVVNEYLSDQIADIGEYVNASTTDDQERDSVEHHLHDVDEALSDGDVLEAMVSTIKAREDINSDNYLNEEFEDYYIEETELNPEK